MWSRLDAPGMEHLTLILLHDEVVADGVVLCMENDAAFRLRYIVRCDPRWRVSRVEVSFVDGGRGLRLAADGEGRWFDGSGAAVPALAGCVDVDVTATPLTNTLPIRRLALKQGESADIRVAYVTIPDLRVAPDEQYTCLEAGPLVAGTGSSNWAADLQPSYRSTPTGWRRTTQGCSIACGRVEDSGGSRTSDSGSHLNSNHVCASSLRLSKPKNTSRSKRRRCCCPALKVTSASS